MTPPPRTPEADDGRSAQHWSRRAALAMAALGALLLLASLLIADERWRLVASISGILLGAVGLLTIAWSRLEDNIPWGRQE